MREKSILFSDADVRRICVIRLRRMGDVVMITPCLRALRRWQPSATITVVINQPFDQLVAHNPSIDEIIAPPRRGWRHVARTARELRRRRFDLAFNFHGGSTSALLTLATGARLRIAERRFRHRFAYNVTVDPAEGYDGEETLHEVEWRMRLLEALGIPRVPLDVEVSVEAAAQERVSNTLAGLLGRKHGQFALIRPTVVDEARRWPTERFAAVADLLLQERGLQCLVETGPGEGEIADAFEQAAQHRHPSVKAASIQDLIALIDAARLVVANDSGPSHVAAALGTPVVVVFGGSDPDVCRPWGERVRTVQHPVHCRPCPKGKCTNPDQYMCLRAVQVSAVQAAIDDLLKGYCHHDGKPE